MGYCKPSSQQQLCGSSLLALWSQLNLQMLPHDERNVISPAVSACKLRDRNAQSAALSPPGNVPDHAMTRATSSAIN
jgi:hypothetical protein